MELGKDKWYAVNIDFKRIAKNIGMLLARPHTLASHGDHFQKEKLEYTGEPTEELAVEDIMGHDLFEKRYHQPELWHGLPYYIEDRELPVKGHIILPRDAVEDYFLGDLHKRLEEHPGD